MKPASIAASADKAAPGIVQQIEDMAGHAGNAPVSTQSAVKVVDDAMKKAVAGNDTDTMTHLRTIRQRLLNTTVPGKSARPSEALHLGNTLDDLSSTLPGNAKTSYGPAQVAGKARDALQTELDKTAPGSAAAHDTISKLIQGGKAAKDAAKSNPSFIQSLARHKVLDLMVGAGTYGMSHSPVKAMAAAAATHAITSPVTRVAAARAAASPMTPAMVNAVKAMLMQQTQPNGAQPPQY
jgi:hypothetical protein